MSEETTVAASSTAQKDKNIQEAEIDSEEEQEMSVPRLLGAAPKLKGLVIDECEPRT
jgi:hypothetical protein